MKSWIKAILFSLLIIFLVLAALLSIPFKERPIQELDNSMLLGYYQIGGFGGFEDRLIVYENGSVLLAGGADIEGDFFYTKLSDSELKIINNFIQNKQYRIKQNYNLDRFTTVSKDSIFSQLLIKIDGKTIVIEQDKALNPIITRLLQIRHSNQV